MSSNFFGAVTLGLSMIACGHAQAECYGEGEYQVCSDVTTDANGDVHVHSHDTEGNDYSVHSETRQDADGGTHVRSYDSEGNSYSVNSWTDSSGVHTEDSDGNTCTITTSGEMIGCGE